jgi:hypothetical protein
MTSNTDVIWANRAAKALLLIRILVGWVFLSEGIQKFLFPESLGVGRFSCALTENPGINCPASVIRCWRLSIVKPSPSSHSFSFAGRENTRIPFPLRFTLFVLAHGRDPYL